MSPAVKAEAEARAAAMQISLEEFVGRSLSAGFCNDDLNSLGAKHSLNFVPGPSGAIRS
ncbi:hypothetical protein [Plesiocystis pacifica]|nr:hypothetical protein [Plesiocystis pacifica]